MNNFEQHEFAQQLADNESGYNIARMLCSEKAKNNDTLKIAKRLYKVNCMSLQIIPMWNAESIAIRDRYLEMAQNFIQDGE